MPSTSIITSVWVLAVTEYPYGTLTVTHSMDYQYPSITTGICIVSGYWGIFQPQMIYTGQGTQGSKSASDWPEMLLKAYHLEIFLTVQAGFCTVYTTDTNIVEQFLFLVHFML